jgi:hypothetical protein
MVVVGMVDVGFDVGGVRMVVVAGFDVVGRFVAVDGVDEGMPLQFT